MCRQFSLLQPAGTVTTNSGMHSCHVSFISGNNVVPIGHGNSFRLVLESHKKVMENDFPKSGHPEMSLLHPWGTSPDPLVACRALARSS